MFTVRNWKLWIVRAANHHQEQYWLTHANSTKKHSLKLHDECYLLSKYLIQHENCFDFLYVSRKTHRETKRLLFAIIKWFIDNFYMLKKWFVVISRDFLFTINHLHLDMHMKNNFSNDNNITIAWKIAIFEFIFTKLFDF